MTQTMIKSKPVLAAEAVLRELLETLPSSPNLIETLTLNMLAAYEFTKTEEAFYAQYLFGGTTSGNELVDALDDTVAPTEPQFTAPDEDYETTFEFYSPDEAPVVTQEQKDQSDAEALDAFKQRFGAPSSAPLPIKWPKPEVPAAPATQELFTQPQLMIAGKVINILTEMFDMADNVPITQNMTLYTLPIPDTTCGPLDSLDIVELVMMIEETFDIEIPNEDAETFETKTFGEIVRFIEKAM